MSVTVFVAIVGGVFALLLLGIGIYVTTRSERSLVEDRLEHFLEDELEFAQEGESSALVTDWLTVQVERTSWGDRISKNLAQADVKLKVGEYVALHIIAAAGVGALAWFIGGMDFISGIIGMVIGFFIPRTFLKRSQAKRLKTFSSQLPDMLNLVVNGLRAGFSTMQALEAVSREMPSPINVEFRRVVQEMQLGVSMENSLANLLRRIPSDDLDLVITAINVQREVGGNLAEILETISHTIRERIKIKGDIQVLVSQVIYSGRFLSILPLILSCILYLVNKPYISMFGAEPKICGICMVSLAAGMVIAGYIAMNKIADIEV